MIDNCADDWRIAMTWQRMMQIGMLMILTVPLFIHIKEKYTSRHVDDLNCPVSYINEKFMNGNPNQEMQHAGEMSHCHHHYPFVQHMSNTYKSIGWSGIPEFSICLKLLTRKLLFVLLSNCLFLLISIIIISIHCKVMYTHINQFHIIAGMELLVCAVHPIPGRFYFLWTTKLSNHGGKIGSQWVPVDVTLSLPMFLRYGFALQQFPI